MLQKSIKKREIARALAGKHKLTEEQVNNLLTDLFEMIRELVLQKQKVLLYRFGSFFLRKRKPRPMIHPRTGVPMVVPEREVVFFCTARSFNQSARSSEKLKGTCARETGRVAR